MKISIWEKDGYIHINLGIYDIEGVTGMSTINNMDNSKISHQHLYNQFKKILKYNNKW